MRAAPCALCGYAAERAPCPHCRLSPAEPSLRSAAPRGFGAVRAGLAALFHGLRLLATTGGTKRWLVPPFALTLAAFVWLSWWLWSQVEPWIEKVEQRGAELSADASWLRRAAEWLISLKATVWLAKLGALASVLAVVVVASLWAFSIVYEAFAGPFLDEIHGRIERRWFGANPRDTLTRPTGLSSSTCALWTTAGLGWAGMALILSWKLPGWPGAIALVSSPAVLALLAWRSRDYRRWLAWVVRLEGGTLWVSLKASLVAAAFLVLCFPLKFVPVIGLPLFATAAGFTTAVSLLDIPFERRQWPFRMRWRFLLGNAPAFAAFGVTAGLVFVIPLVGPVLMVPAASVGGLWLVCRLDKSRLAR